VRNHAFDFGVDPGRIAAIGGSAGGHLSALLATLGQGPHERDARVTAAVSWAGPMDLHLDEFPAESHPYLEAFLDCVGRPCDEAAVVAASPISHVDPSDAPILLIQGNEDLLVPLDQAERMAAALERAGVRRELVIVPAGHDSRLWPFVFEPTYEFLRRELGGVEPAPPGAIGNGGGAGYVAPVIAVVIAGLAIGAVVVVARRRRQVRY
jgi:dipeptidyl aminopeptidase/acylaminoacyl peptidase